MARVWRGRSHDQPQPRHGSAAVIGDAPLALPRRVETYEPAFASQASASSSENVNPAPGMPEAAREP